MWQMHKKTRELLIGLVNGMGCQQNVCKTWPRIHLKDLSEPHPHPPMYFVFLRKWRSAWAPTSGICAQLIRYRSELDPGHWEQVSSIYCLHQQQYHLIIFYLFFYCNIGCCSGLTVFQWKQRISYCEQGRGVGGNAILNSTCEVWRHLFAKITVNNRTKC